MAEMNSKCHIILAKSQNFVECWDVATGELKHSAIDYDSGIKKMCCSLDNKYFAGVYIDFGGPADEIQCHIKIWNSSTYILFKILSVNYIIADICFSADGKNIFLLSYGRPIEIYDVETGKLKKTLSSSEFISCMGCMGCSHDGKWIAVGTYKRTIEIWDMETYERTNVISGHTGSITYVCFSPDSKYIASASIDLTIKIWDTETLQLVHTFNNRKHYVQNIIFSSDSKHIATTSFDKAIRQWNIETGKLMVFQTPQHVKYFDRIFFIQYLPGDKLIICARHNGPIEIWEAETGKLVRVMTDHPCSSMCVLPVS
jgi:WD40 repeat protein